METCSDKEEVNNFSEKSLITLYRQRLTDLELGRGLGLGLGVALHKSVLSFLPTTIYKI